MRLRGIIALLTLMAICAGCTISNPPINETSNSSANTTVKEYPPVRGFDIEYCEGLGYAYQYFVNATAKVEYCTLPNGTRCLAWDFASGTCAQEFTLCEIKGYTLKLKREVYPTYNVTYPICIFPDDSYCKESDFYKRNCHVQW
jgi:putative hemolysin